MDKIEKASPGTRLEKRAVEFFNHLGSWLISPINGADRRTWHIAWIGGLFLLGLVLWGQFLNWGRIPFDFHDWAEISAPRLAFVQDAVKTGQLPLHMPDGSALRNVTDRFMAIPDVMVSPQMVLLSFMDVGSFILVNTWLFYSLGFLGLLWYRRKFSLSPVVFAVLVLLFNFNGSLLAHFSVGHVNYTGFFLFPFLIALLIQMLEGEKGWGWTAKFAFLMFFILLQGSFHQFVWGLMLTGLVGLFRWKYLRQTLMALVAACLLSMVRLLPPALLLGVFDNEFLSGYPTLADLFTALVVPVGPENALAHKSILTSLGWWEFDLYTGILGAATLLIFGIFFWIRNINRDGQYNAFFLPAVTLFVLSMGRVYRIFMYLPIPIINGERVSARFLSLVFVLVILIAAINMNRWLKDKNQMPWIGWGCAALLLVQASDLWQNLKLWRVNVAYDYFPKTPVDLAIKVVSNHGDINYSLTLVIGSVVTVISAILLLLAPRLFKFQKKQ